MAPSIFLIRLGVKAVKQSVQAHMDHNAPEGTEPKVRYDKKGRVEQPGRIYNLVTKAEQRWNPRPQKIAQEQIETQGRITELERKEAYGDADVLASRVGRGSSVAADEKKGSGGGEDYGPQDYESKSRMARYEVDDKDDEVPPPSYDEITRYQVDRVSSFPSDEYKPSTQVGGFGTASRSPFAPEQRVQRRRNSSSSSSSFSSSSSSDDDDHRPSTFGDRTSRRVDKAARKAERRVRKAERKAERRQKKIDREMRKIDRDTQKEMRKIDKDVRKIDRETRKNEMKLQRDLARAERR